MKKTEKKGGGGNSPAPTGEPIQDDQKGLRRFIEDGCSARPEDKHDALAALDRLVAELGRLREQVEKPEEADQTYRGRR